AELPQEILDVRSHSAVGCIGDAGFLARLGELRRRLVVLGNRPRGVTPDVLVARSSERQVAGGYSEIVHGLGEAHEARVGQRVDGAGSAGAAHRGDGQGKQERAASDRCHGGPPPRITRPPRLRSTPRTTKRRWRAASLVAAFRFWHSPPPR